MTLGAPLLWEHKKKLTNLFPNRFFELYGLTEGFMTCLSPSDFLKKPLSVGRPISFSEMKIIGENGKDLVIGEIGEIVGRCPLLMTSYYKEPGKTKEVVKDGWLSSGDIGYIDEQGYLFLVDRKKDMLISGGINVYPRDIEEVIAKHNEIRDVAVFGIPHDKFGEVPVAAIILIEGSKQNENDLKNWTNERVQAKFQRIHNVYIFKQFPLSISGKILKREIQKLVLNQKAKY